MLRCLRSLLSEKAEKETWAYLRVGEENVPVQHWENLLGKARSADIRLFGEGISPIHAVLRRSDRGEWKIFDIFSKGGVWVNNNCVPRGGLAVFHGDTVNLGGSCVKFLNISTSQRERNEKKRTDAGTLIHPGLTLAELTLLQLLLLLQHSFTARRDQLGIIIVSFVTLMVLEWCVFQGMRVLGRMGFEIEILAFFLTTLGLSVAASSVPEDLYKQILLNILIH